MKFWVLFMSVLFTAQAFAAPIALVCKNAKGDPKSDFIMDATAMTMKVDAKNVQFKTRYTGGVLKGNFSMIAKNGFYYYDSTDLNDICPDQVDFAYVIVSPDLVKGKKKTGPASLTCRQVGDSEGYSWITATFTCKVADAI